MDKLIAGTLPPLINFPLIVISCEPLRFIGLEAVYPLAAAVLAVVVTTEPVVTAGVAVVAVAAELFVAEVAPVAGVVAPVGVVAVEDVVEVAAVEDVEPDGVVAVFEPVLAPAAVVSATLAGVIIASFLQDAIKKVKAMKKA
ncbi:MAG: hypothetical protein NVSMB24_16270 [Mucilaginibacter sp.]